MLLVTWRVIWYSMLGYVADGLFSDIGAEEENASWTEDAICEGQGTRLEWRYI